MAWFFIPLIFAGAVALITLAVITLKKLIEWIKKIRTGARKEKAEIITQKLADGDYNVVVGVFTRPFIFKKYSGKANFKGKKVDNDLKKITGNKKKAVIYVRDLL